MTSSSTRSGDVRWGYPQIELHESSLTLGTQDAKKKDAALLLHEKAIAAIREILDEVDFYTTGVTQPQTLVYEYAMAIDHISMILNELDR